MKIEWKKYLGATVALFSLYLCIHYWDAVAGLIATAFAASLPLIIGFVIAYFVNIPMSFFEKHLFPKTEKKWLLGLKKVLCLVLAYLSFVVVIGLIIIVVIPEFVACIELLVNKLIEWFNNIDTSAIAQYLPDDIIGMLEGVDWKSLIEKAFNFLSNGISGVTSTVVGVLGAVFSGIVTAVVAVIFSIYLLADRDKLCGQFSRLSKNYLPEKWDVRLRYFISVLNASFRGYTVGQGLEAVILGVLCFLGMTVFRMPYAAMIGTLVGFTALIPVAGAYIGAGVGAFMILTVSPIQALWFLVFILVLQQVEGNLIYPRVVGSSVGLPGIWVLAAVTVGGGLFGVVGMLVAVPLAATVYKLLRNDLNKREAAVLDSIPSGEEDTPAEPDARVVVPEPTPAQIEHKKGAPGRKPAQKRKLKNKK